MDRYVYVRCVDTFDFYKNNFKSKEQTHGGISAPILYFSSNRTKNVIAFSFLHYIRVRFTYLYRCIREKRGKKINIRTCTRVYPYVCVFIQAITRSIFFFYASVCSLESIEICRKCNFPVNICVCVCLCVCMWERERKRRDSGEYKRVFHILY